MERVIKKQAELAKGNIVLDKGEEREWEDQS
jgi:hypothetical protein